MFDIDLGNDQNVKVTFYTNISSNTIGLRTLTSLDKAYFKTLKVKEKTHIWGNGSDKQSYDGPVMLQICIEKVNPSTRLRKSQ